MATKRSSVSSADRKNSSKTSSLVIVESRTKADTLQKFLGNGYRVLASVGHVRDLPNGSIGVDVVNEFKPLYVVPRDKRRIVAEIGEAAQQARSVILATDPDREGEAIAWHLLGAAQLDPDKVQRVTFHEITEEALQSAMEHPSSIDMDLVDSQQARRILDRLVGFQIGPLLSKRIHGANSAGRVQSVALRFVVEREREVVAFVPQEWWSIQAGFSRSAKDMKVFQANLELVRGKLDIPDKEASVAIIDTLQDATFRVDGIKERSTTARPAAPFTTATLQRAASSRLQMSPSSTMRVAQQLYEGIDVGGPEGQVGLITYMRTDSYQVAPSAQAQTQAFITERFGSDHLPNKPPIYRTKNRTAQEAHEAIRPTSVHRTPESIGKYLDKRQSRVYELIWRRFVASQMKPAKLRALTVLISGSHGSTTSPYRFRATTSETLFDGHFVVTRSEAKTDKQEEIARQVLLSLQEGDKLLSQETRGVQHFTEPPPRYTEASLIRELEEGGIGRPSTYAPTIETLQKRRYVELQARTVHPTELGESVTDALVEHFPEIVDKTFTSRMESDLDLVASGKRARIDFLREFWSRFSPTLVSAKENMKAIKAPIEPLDEACPECGAQLFIRSGWSGKFVGCSGFPECRYTRTLGIGVDCPKCEEGLVVERLTRRRRRFFGCSKFPDCDYASWKRPTNEACPVCGNVLYASGRQQIACNECGHKQAAA